MGKRSRRQIKDGAQARAEAEERRSRLRDRASAAAAVSERRIRERPPAPWDPFPLTELAILLGMAGLVVSFVTSGDLSRAALVAGLTLASLGGLETAIREHFHGYRTHAGLLAGTLALVALAASTAVARIGYVPRAAIAVGVFALVYPVLRREFVRRSGGRRA